MDRALHAVAMVHLTEAGRRWIREQGLDDISKIENIGDRIFERTQRTLYEGLDRSIVNLREEYAARGNARLNG